MTIFRSDFSDGPDFRWQVRRTPRGTDGSPRWSEGKLVLRIRRADNAAGYVTSHIYVPELVLTPPVRVRARMRFMGGPGAHSALWLQSDPPYATPAHTEIDVVEHLGASDRLHQWVYWRDGEQMCDAHNALKLDPKVSRVYGVDWHADRVVFTVDGQVVYGTTEGASTEPKHLVASMLVSDWELPNLRMDELWTYRTLVDWVQVDRIEED